MSNLAFKQQLFDELEALLHDELKCAIETQKKTVAGATHEESKAENDKDTRALESTYLARGQAMRVHQLEDDLEQLHRLRLRDFDADSPIALGACVQLEQNGDDKFFFVAASGAGLRVGSEPAYLVVTPSSPVGRALLGQYEGDEIQLRTPLGLSSAEIIGVF